MLTAQENNPKKSYMVHWVETSCQPLSKVATVIPATLPLAECTLSSLSASSPPLLLGKTHIILLVSYRALKHGYTPSSWVLTIPQGPRGVCIFLNSIPVLNGILLSSELFCYTWRVMNCPRIKSGDYLSETSGRMVVEGVGPGKPLLSL